MGDVNKIRYILDLEFKDYLLFDEISSSGTSKLQKKKFKLQAET